jgi:hypothetical protein
MFTCGNRPRASIVSNSRVEDPEGLSMVGATSGHIPQPESLDRRSHQALGWECEHQRLPHCLAVDGSLVRFVNCLPSRVAFARLPFTRWAPSLRMLVGEWPGALQPPALTEPYVTVSRHTAPTIRSVAWVIRQALNFGSAIGSSHKFVVDLKPRLDGPSASLQPHYRTFIATTGRSAPVPRIRNSPSRFPPLEAFPGMSSRRS